MMPALLLIPLGALALAYLVRREGAGELVGVSPVQPGAADDEPLEYFSSYPATVSPDPAPIEMTLARTFQLPRAGAPYADTINAAESRYGIPPSLLARVLHEESGFRPDVISGRVKSTAGAVGIAQFMPATAAGLGVDPLDPHSAIDGAARYLKQLFDQFGDWARALAAYNWGPGRVQRQGIERAPAETRGYVSRILGDVSA